MSAKIFFCLKMQKPFNMRMYIYTYVYTYTRSFLAGVQTGVLEGFLILRAKNIFGITTT